jgi:hypothetical protein
VAALIRPLDVRGIFVPAIVAAALPVILLAITTPGKLGRPAGAVLLAGYAGWVSAVLVHASSG